MIRNLKVMGIAIIALVVMSALASSASAQFESESSPVRVTVGSNAMQKFSWVAGGTAIECTTLTIEGTVASTAGTMLEVTPKYSKCETFLGAATSVNTNGCHYVFTLPKGATTGEPPHIVCTGASLIEIIIGGICRYTIGSQTPTGHVVFLNKGSGETREIEVQPNLTGIVSTRTTNDFFCPAGGNTGTYTGNAVITGENEAGTTHTGIFVD